MDIDRGIPYRVVRGAQRTVAGVEICTPAIQLVGGGMNNGDAVDTPMVFVGRD